MPLRHRTDVVQGKDRIAGEALEQAFIDHLLGSGHAHFLGRLENEVHRAVKGPAAREVPGRRQQHGRVTIMTTGMHAAIVPGAVGKAVFFLHGQRIQIGAQTDRARALALTQDTHHPGARQTGVDLQTPFAQPLGDQGAGAMLVKAEFRMGVDIAPELGEKSVILEAVENVHAVILNGGRHAGLSHGFVCYKFPMLIVGSLNLDLVGQAPRIPAPGETVLGHRLLRFEGGKGGNQAVAAARMGASVRFVGAVGEDDAGQQLVAGLEAEGIDTRGIQRLGPASGCALITVSDAGENAITVLPGANALCPMPDGPIPPTDWLLLQMEVPAEVNLAWARAVRDAGGQVMLNAAPCSDAVRPLLPWVDLLVVNEGELHQLAGVSADGSIAMREALRALGPRAVVITLGAKGCAAWQGGLWWQVEAESVQVVDTTGAGDTFTGALAAVLARGQSLEDALPLANRAAGRSCQRMGAREAMPRWQDLDA